MFESSVNLKGNKTIKIKECAHETFESSVNLKGN